MDASLPWTGWSKNLTHSSSEAGVCGGDMILFPQADQSPFQHRSPQQFNQVMDLSLLRGVCKWLEI